MSIEKETLGRLYLWQVALNRINDLLEFRKRVERFCSSGRPHSITELYDEERARLKIGTRLDGEVLDNFENKHGSLFPDIHDVHIISELLTEEIIIKFCTIFNDGYGRVGVVAGNRKTFWEPILDDVISGAFPDDTRQDFEQFIKQAKLYRDKQGAHFDQSSFFVKHGDKQPHEDGMVSHVGWTSALLSFDWDYVGDAIPKFSKSLNSHIRKLQRQANLIS